MSRSKHTEAQIIAALKQVEAGRSMEDVGREYGVSKHTIYAWKAKYGGMSVSEAQEMKQLREENARLKKLVADLSLDKDMLQSVIRKNRADRCTLSPNGKVRHIWARRRISPFNLPFAEKCRSLLALAADRVRIAHVSQGQDLISREVIHWRHGQKAIKLLVGGDFINPSSAVAANHVIATFELAVGFELFTILGLLRNGANYVGR